MYRLYGQKQSETFATDLSILLFNNIILFITSTPVKKKRGRPLRLKNNKKKKKKKKKKQKIASADIAFQVEFGHVSPTVAVNEDVADNEVDSFFVGNDSIALYEGDINDGTLKDLVVAADQLNEAASHSELSYDQQQHQLEEEVNVGFGEVDVLDVEELIGLGRESNGKDEDIMKELRESCIADSSKNNDSSAITLLIFYYYKFGKYRLHKPWIQTLNTLPFNI